MQPYNQLSPEELVAELSQQRICFNDYKKQKLKLNMARGKPAPEQLDLSMPMLDLLPGSGSDADLRCGQSDDLRNYGGLLGIDALRQLFGSVLGVPAVEVMVAGNSSLTLMYNLVSLSMTHGVLGEAPWSAQDGPIKFLCPTPGYDRHFAICEHFGIEMIAVPLTPDGPDMQLVEHLVNTDPRVKGIWCVPRFANPSGVVYSKQTVERFANLCPAAPDFRIYWDNAYAVHELSPLAPQLANLALAAAEAGNPNIYYQFASTSKITFAGAGVAALACSKANLDSLVKLMGIQSIGPDKINQERHALFLPNLEALQCHMSAHAAIIRPKFEVVLQVLQEGLGGLEIGSWSRPAGGYFISFDGPQGTAKRTVELCAEAGVVLTEAGATYPYGNDPDDANIRIAPTYPNLDDLRLASEILVCCVRLATLERLSNAEASPKRQSRVEGPKGQK